MFNSKACINTDKNVWIPLERSKITGHTRISGTERKPVFEYIAGNSHQLKPIPLLSQHSYVEQEPILRQGTIVLKEPYQDKQEDFQAVAEGSQADCMVVVETFRKI